MSSLKIATRFSEFLDRRDLAGLETLLAENFAAKGPTAELNKQQTLAYLRVLFTAIPDYQFGLTDFEENGEVVRCASHEGGTHLGVLDLRALGLPVVVPPTGKSFELPSSTLTFRVVNDRVEYFGEEAVPRGGLAGMLDQLGVKLPGR